MLRFLPLFLLLVPAMLRAQPAPDAPVPEHVAHLIRLSGTRFRDVSGGAPTYGPGTTLNTSVYATGYRMRFQGDEATSQIRVNHNWNVLHLTWLPVGEDRAGLPAVWTMVADSIRAAIPPGWTENRTEGERPFVWWAECEGSAGSQVSLATSLQFEAPALVLIVYRFDAPCPRG